MSSERIPAAARRKIERLERENEELRAEIAGLMNTYRECLYELVTYKLRVVVVSQTDVTVAKMRSGSTFWVEAP